MSTYLQKAQAFEADDNLFESARHYALAIDNNEAATAQDAIQAALTFFEAKDNLPGRIAEDEYAYFDRWIDRAEQFGAGPHACYWKAYDAWIYGDGPEVKDEAFAWYAAGCQDALLTLALQDHDRFALEAAAFVHSLQPTRTYRARYLYSVLGQRFDEAT